MKEITRYTWDKDEDRRSIADTLRQAKVVAGSSDTVPGLLAMTNDEGFQALNRIKARTHKPYIVLIASEKELDYYAQGPFTAWVGKLADAFWPGPMTLIIRARKDLPEWLKSTDDTIAVRVPHHEGLLDLLHQTGSLFSTSANLTGQPVPSNVADLDPAILGQVAAVIDDNQESKQGAILPSTLVDCTGDEPHIIREGAISKDRIMRVTSLR